MAGVNRTTQGARGWRQSQGRIKMPYFKTRNASGKSFSVKFSGGKNDDQWAVTVTDDNINQDHGTFTVQDDALFGIAGLDNIDTGDVVMIQNEIAQIMMDDENDSYFSPYDLCDSRDNNAIRKATWNEAWLSATASVEGHIVVGTVTCYVQMKECQRKIFLAARP